MKRIQSGPPVKSIKKMAVQGERKFMKKEINSFLRNIRKICHEMPKFRITKSQITYALAGKLVIAYTRAKKKCTITIEPRVDGLLSVSVATR